MEQQVVELFGTLSIGASGAVSAFYGGGISNIVKETAAGQYSITLDAKYYKFLGFDYNLVDDGISQISAIQILEDPATFQADVMADSTFKIQLLAPTSSSVTTSIAANAADGAQVMFRITVRNTSINYNGSST